MPGPTRLLASLALSFAALAPCANAAGSDAEGELLGRIADPKLGGNERAKAIRDYIERARADGRCAAAAAQLDVIVLERNFPAWLRRVGAEAIAGCADEATARYLAGGIARGETRERLHALRAARGLDFPAVEEAARKALSAEDPRVRNEAAELLARHKALEAAGELATVVAKGKDRELLESALHAATELQRGTAQWPAWEKRLVEWAGGDDELRRRSAFAELLADDLDACSGLALTALACEDWSARVLAVAWLTRNPSPGRLDALVARLGEELDNGRVHGDIVRALVELTGVKHLRSQEGWVRWRQGAGRDWKPGQKVGTNPQGGSSEPRTTAARFYGVEIASARTVFVVDLSGSMGALSKAPGEEQKKRIDVARGELLQLVDVLPPGSWFNIVGFGDAVLPWLDGLAEFSGGKRLRRDERGELSPAAKKRDEEMRGQAREFIGRLALAGSTNIYDALEFAFRDPDVDTICFMTDGTPTAGTETEAIAIREELVRWNRSRRIRIHCIAVGEDQPLPKWLAADHDGVHRFVP
ncbi:MAG: hypothetical protein NTV21_18965 [Planctomycetota bacterium]|nr:hypothetical protein [Planctomycetota bacterium]